MLALLIPTGCSEDDDDPIIPTWQTVFEDDFNRTTLGDDWDLVPYESQDLSSLYSVNGETIQLRGDDALNDGDGPMFLFIDSISYNRFKLSAVISSTIANEMEAGFVVGYVDGDNFFGTFIFDNVLTIISIDDGAFSEISEKTFSPALTSNQDYIIETECNNSTISFSLKNINGSIIDSTSSTISTPLPTGKLGIGGETGNGNEGWVYYLS